MTARFLCRAPFLGALFVCLTANAMGGGDCSADRVDDQGRIAYVHDGDTLHLQDGRKLRLVGINTPELARDDQPAEPLAKTARTRLRDLLPVGSKVMLRLGEERHDPHGRVLAHVFSQEGTNVTRRLLGEGLGFAVAIAPNLWANQCYFAAERRARRADKGVWQNAYFRARPVKQLTRADTGFRRIRGRVSRTGTSRKALWLNFPASVAIRIAKDDLTYFADANPRLWRGKELVARGWLNYYKGRLLLHVSHPTMIESTNRTEYDRH